MAEKCFSKEHFSPDHRYIRETLQEKHVYFILLIFVRRVYPYTPILRNFNNKAIDPDFMIFKFKIVSTKTFKNIPSKQTKYNFLMREVC